MYPRRLQSSHSPGAVAGSRTTHEDEDEYVDEYIHEDGDAHAHAARGRERVAHASVSEVLRRQPSSEELQSDAACTACSESALSDRSQVLGAVGASKER